MDLQNPEDIKESLVLFESDFQLEPSYLKIDQTKTFTFENAYRLIYRVVQHLISNDFNGLINTLYRIDVSEQKLKKALAKTSEDPAALISQMIIERELQKVETRRKYR